MSQPRVSHLPRRIAHAQHASGPFSFVNPTTRYVNIAARRADQHDGQAASSGQASSGDALLGESVTAAGNGPAPSVDAITVTNGDSNEVEAEAGSRPPSSAEPQEAQKPQEQVKRQKQPKEHVAGAFQIWRSRDNRKGRHAIVLTSDFFSHHHPHYHHHHRHHRDDGAKPTALPPSTNSFRGVLHVLGKMATRFPVWDVSYDVAVIFTLGSVVWVINSFFVWLPLAAPSTEFPGEETTAGGVSAIVGATIFEVGAVLGMLEAVNESRADCFGWALEEALESGMLSLRPSPDDCRHAHVERTGLLRRRRGGGDEDKGDNSNSSSSSSDADTDDNDAPSTPSTPGTPGTPDTPGTPIPSRRQWSWWPSWRELRTVYARELGFWACAIQLCGATIFWISGFTGLPPILDRLSPAATDGIFWLPQVVGGIGFIVSSVLFMLETQRKWYLPAPQILGWHIGVWNLVGAIGFTLCGALGFGAASSDAVAYASTLSTFVGSWAFLIGSIIQWYESLDKYPIQIQEALPAHVQQ